MARKSRRNKAETTTIKVVQKKENLLETGGYIRLSVENGGHETEDTLMTQKKLVEDFIRNHPDLNLADIYIDNGYTGTDFDRPEFSRLMQDVKSGRIQCIVVKDLSRFGRNYLETGYYLETIFPKLNVRFIAVTDDFDSSRAADRENISIPIKNLVNELYAKDMSRKIQTAKEIQRMKGVTKIAKAPYGYVISEDHRHLEVDGKVAPYVRMIFQWTLMGVKNKAIADRLNLLRVATPGQHEKTGAVKVGAGETKWNSGTVDKILGNPNYSGDLVTGRIRQSLYKGIKFHWTKPDEWNVVKNSHDALVARDDYEKLWNRKKEISEARRAVLDSHIPERGKYTDCFSGIVRCARCGSTMYYARYTHDYQTNVKVGAYYVGKSRHADCSCKNYKIEENLLKITVMDQIQLLIEAMAEKKEILDKIKNGNNGALAKMRQRCIGIERNIAQTEERNARRYMDFAEGIVEEDDYHLMKERNISEAHKLKEEYQKADAQLRGFQKKLDTCLETIRNVGKFHGDRRFNEKLVKELVDYIEIDPDGAINVCFKCSDGFREIAELVERDWDGKDKG